jgi:hypothetical protein
MPAVVLTQGNQPPSQARIAPSSLTLVGGQNATFTATVQGTPPLFYQWRFNGNPIADATNVTLDLNNVNPGNAGNYSVSITNAYGSVTSSPASLAVVDPVILYQPVSRTVSFGQSATFSVTAGGTTPFGYQWQFNGAAIPNATNATLALSNVSGAAAGNYSVLVSNPYGSTNSSAASLRVVDPLISSQPVSRTVSVGRSAAFNVTASGTQPISYQWRFNGIVIPYETNVTLTLNNVSSAAAGNYSVTVTNAYGSVTSSLAYLTVLPGCELRIVTAGPCLADSSPGIPQVGNAYGLKITVNIIGTPAQPFRIKWTIANVTYYTDNIRLGPGNGYWWWFDWWVNLDDAMPWSVTLDPDGVTGNTNLVNNTASGTFTPTPPTNAVDLYSPRLMHGSESYTLNFQPGSGNLNNLWVVFGVPTTHGAQTALSMSPPTNGQLVITPPCSVPAFVISRTNVPAAIFSDTNYFTVQLNNIRVNPIILRTNTWASLATMTTNWTQWLPPDQMDQSTDATIAGFVHQSLPTNYQAVLTPYDTARTLHRAVMRKLTYQSPPPHLDAVNVLKDGVADCGGFAHLLTACLRNVGIPARMISGFWQGSSQWHCRVEFHLPGVEWLLADPTEGNGADPTGTYAWYFGYVPDANQYLAVDVGDAHILPYNNFPFLQVPNWWWSGGGTFNSSSAVSYLQPNGVLQLSNSTQNAIQLLLSDTPTAGSVVLQTSTNLITWTPVATNSAGGANINYSFATTNSAPTFYRASVVP